MNQRTVYIIVFVFTLVSFLTICGFAHQWKQVLSIENIEVENEYMVNEDEILKLAGIKVGDGFYDVSLDSVRNRLLVQKYIKEVIITRKMNGVVHIDVRERRPIANLNLGKTWYIDREGVLLSKIQSNVILDLPVISGFGTNMLAPNSSGPTFVAGNKVPSADVTIALSILTSSLEVDEDLYYLISEINLNHGRDIFIYTSDYGIPINIGREQYKKKLQLLSTFWRQFVIPKGAGNLESVDVRFNDQVVVRWKPEEVKKSLETMI